MRVRVQGTLSNNKLGVAIGIGKARLNQLRIGIEDGLEYYTRELKFKTFDIHVIVREDPILDELLIIGKEAKTAIVELLVNAYDNVSGTVVRNRLTEFALELTASETNETILAVGLPALTSFASYKYNSDFTTAGREIISSDARVYYDDYFDKHQLTGASYRWRFNHAINAWLFGARVNLDAKFLIPRTALPSSWQALTTRQYVVASPNTESLFLERQSANTVNHNDEYVTCFGRVTDFNVAPSGVPDASRYARYFAITIHRSALPYRWPADLFTVTLTRVPKGHSFNIEPANSNLVLPASIPATDQFVNEFGESLYFNPSFPNRADLLFPTDLPINPTVDGFTVIPEGVENGVEHEDGTISGTYYYGLSYVDPPQIQFDTGFQFLNEDDYVITDLRPLINPAFPDHVRLTTQSDSLVDISVSPISTGGDWAATVQASVVTDFYYGAIYSYSWNEIKTEEVTTTYSPTADQDVDIVKQETTEVTQYYVHALLQFNTVSKTFSLVPLDNTNRLMTDVFSEGSSSYSYDGIDLVTSETIDHTVNLNLDIEMPLFINGQRYVITKDELTATEHKASSSESLTWTRSVEAPFELADDGAKCLVFVTAEGHKFYINDVDPFTGIGGSLWLDDTMLVDPFDTDSAVIPDLSDFSGNVGQADVTNRSGTSTLIKDVVTTITAATETSWVVGEDYTSPLTGYYLASPSTYVGNPYPNIPKSAPVLNAATAFSYTNQPQATILRPPLRSIPSPANGFSCYSPQIYQNKDGMCIAGLLSTQVAYNAAYDNLVNNTDPALEAGLRADLEALYIIYLNNYLPQSLIEAILRDLILVVDSTVQYIITVDENLSLPSTP